MPGKGYITVESAQILREMIQYHNTVVRGNTGTPDTSSQTNPDGPYLGKAQADIASGSSGMVHFYFGQKGSETDSNVSITAYNRFSPVNNGDWVLFDIIDSGYEIIPQSPTSSTNNQQNTCCGNCAPEGAPITQSCSAVNPATAFWIIQFFSPFTLTSNTKSLFPCCTTNTTWPTALAWQSGCTWQTASFTCLNNQAQWVLTIGSPFATLVLNIPDQQVSITYRCRADSFSGLCANTFTLWEPKNLPGAPNCPMPCSVCLMPVQNFYCASCAVGQVPASWTVTFPSAFTFPFGGKSYELSQFVTNGTGSPPSSNLGCIWYLNNVPGPSPNMARISLFIGAQAGQPVNYPSNWCLVEMLPNFDWSTLTPPADNNPNQNIAFATTVNTCAGVIQMQPRSTQNWPGVGTHNLIGIPDWEPVFTQSSSFSH